MRRKREKKGERLEGMAVKKKAIENAARTYCAKAENPKTRKKKSCRQVGTL